MSYPLMIEEVLAQPQAVTWLPWAVQYFFFIGIAASAALLGCWLQWRKGESALQFEHRILLIGVTCAITAPLALTADLHQTARFWHFYAYPTPWSWMPWGALFLPLFTLFIGLWFATLQVKRLTGKSFALTRWVALASALVAIGLLLYTGREVSVVRARPVWFSYWFPVIMFISAFQTLFALLLAMTHDDLHRQKWLARGQCASLLLLAAVVLLWVFGDSLSGQAIRFWLDTQPSIRSYALVGTLLWLLALALSAVASTRSLPRAGNIIIALTAMALAWVMRWALLIEVQTLPKYNAIFTPYSLPSGTDGILAIIGTFGLWIALFIIIREALNLISRRVQHG